MTPEGKTKGTIPLTLNELLHKRFPKEMAEFDARPWDHRIYGCCMDEPAEIRVTLFVGKTKAVKAIKLVLPLEASAKCDLCEQIVTWDAGGFWSGHESSCPHFPKA